jgi:hypothetical protein
MPEKASVLNRWHVSRLLNRQGIFAVTLPPGGGAHDFTRVPVACPSAFVARPKPGLSSGMKRPTRTFKIGEQVYHPEGRPRGNRTGPYTIVGMVRQSSGVILFKIKSATREQLAHESELKRIHSA